MLRFSAGSESVLATAWLAGLQDVVSVAGDMTKTCPLGLFVLDQSAVAQSGRRPSAGKAPPQGLNGGSRAWRGQLSSAAAGDLHHVSLPGMLGCARWLVVASR